MIPVAAQQLAAAIIRHYEGCPLTPYWDKYGKCWSIGFGFCTLGDDSPVTANTRPLTSDQCEMFLERKLSTDYMPAVLFRCAGIVLTDGQLGALSSFAWNLGPGVITSSGIPAFLRARSLQGAASAMRQYNRAGGVVLAGLVKRRASETAALLGLPWMEGAPAPASRTAATAVSEADVLNDASLARARSVG